MSNEDEVSKQVMKYYQLELSKVRAEVAESKYSYASSALGAERVILRHWEVVNNTPNIRPVLESKAPWREKMDAVSHYVAVGWVSSEFRAKYIDIHDNKPEVRG